MSARFKRGELPTLGRVAYVQAWADRRGIGKPNKVRVAARVVELRGERRLTTGTRRVALVVLYNRLRRSLGIDKALAAPASGCRPDARCGMV